MKINLFLGLLVAGVVTIVGGILFFTNHAANSGFAFQPEQNLAEVFKDDYTPASAEFDNNKGLKITRLDESVQFSNYTACLPPDYLKTYPKYPSILYKNNSCINNRMKHDVLEQKLANAKWSALSAKDKADMVQEALDYASAHEKDETVDLSVLFLYKGVDDAATYEGANFSPRCLLQGDQKNGPAFAGVLKPKFDSSVVFVDHTDATEARKVKFLKEVEGLYNKGEKIGLKDVLLFLQGNMFRLNPFKSAAMENFIGVLPESAEKRGYKGIGDNTLRRSDVVGSVSLKFYKGPCENPKDSFRFNLGVYWYDKGLSKAVSFPPGDLNTCISQADKDKYLKNMKDMMVDNLKELRDIQAKYGKEVVTYANALQKLENGDQGCFGLATSADDSGNGAAETAVPVKSVAPYQGYAPSAESLAKKDDSFSPSAIIVDTYTMIRENKVLSCKNNSLCYAPAVDSSRSAQQTFTTSPPSYDIKEGKMIISSQITYPSAHAKDYGITGCSESGYLNGYVNIGTAQGKITKICSGPKGRAETISIPPDSWSWQGFSNDNNKSAPSGIKGSDQSSGWTDGQGGQFDAILETYSYGGDSTKMLIIKGNPSRQYSVVINAFAREWYLTKSAPKGSGTDFNPEYVENGKEIFCPSIRVMRTKLNYDCKMSFVLSPGTYDVTPSVIAPRYSYTVNVISITDAGKASSQNPQSVSYPYQGYAPSSEGQEGNATSTASQSVVIPVSKPFCHTWTKPLTIDDHGEDVLALSQALVKEGIPDAKVRSVFDEELASRLVVFQEKYAADVLTPYHWRLGTGFLGASTRAKLNQLYGCDNQNASKVQ